MLKNRILSSVGGDAKLYVDDVFTSYVRTGTGTDAVINTGIDMTKGYMLWSKSRSAATDHAVYDSARGVTLDLVTNSTAAQTTQSTGLKAVSSTGHTIGSLAKMNTSGATYVDWVWKKAPKFFDVVTYTGNGASSRAIAHSLGQEVGMVMTKATSTTGDWNTYHRSATGDLVLNTTAAQTGSKALVNSATTSTFTVSGAANTNAVTYVAYIFAHDPSADGIIQCGSFTENTPVNLGWEPQYVITKRTDNISSWRIFDAARGLSGTTTSKGALLTNFSQAEDAAADLMYVTATGFNGNANYSGTTIYLAIRRPNKPPTTGTEVYNAIARTGTGVAATVTGVGFAPDLVMIKRQNAVVDWLQIDRLRGGSQQLLSTVTQAEMAVASISDSTLFSTSMDGVLIKTDTNVNGSGGTYINHFFKRAPGVFSTLCYRGTGSNKTEVHDLTKAPSLMIVKSRSSANDWNVWCNGLLGTEKLVLNSTAAKVTDATAWNSTVPTSSVISLGTAAGTNTNAATYVAYLFSTLSGISKIGSYTGNGTSQTINCGFTTGARFILIKRTDSAGNWIIADSTRGILSGADPALYLNSTAAEATGVDWVDPNIVGFDIIQEGTMNANVNGASYIYLAIS